MADLGQEKQKLSMIVEQISEKLGKKKEELTTEFNSLLAEENKQSSALPEHVRYERARLRLKAKYKEEIRSPALLFEGIVIGSSEPFDVSLKEKDAAVALFKKNPQKAIAEGFTNAEGTPLDRRKTFGNGKINQRFGKPLPKENLLRSITGLVSHEGKIKPFRMLLGNDRAKLVVPMYVPVQFRANIAQKQDNENILTLNGSSRTTFEAVKIDGFPKVEEIFNGPYFQHLKVPIGDLMEHATENKDDASRQVIIEGTVVYLDNEPNANGSYFMLIEDEDADLDTDGVACFVPGILAEQLDFGKGSKVFVIGRDNVGERDGAPNVTINATGVYAPPMYRTRKDEVPEQIVTNAKVAN